MAVVFPAPAGRWRAAAEPASAHLQNQGRLPRIECSPVRRHFQQGQIHRRLLDGRTVALSRRGEQALFSVADAPRGVQLRAGHGIDRRAVDPPQRLRFLDAVTRRGEGNRPAIEHLIDQQVHQCRGMFSGHVDGAKAMDDLFNAHQEASEPPICPPRSMRTKQSAEMTDALRA